MPSQGMTGPSTFGSQSAHIINPYENGGQTLVPLTRHQVIPTTGHVYVPIMTSQYPSGLVQNHGMNQNAGMGQHVNLVQSHPAVQTLIHVPTTLVHSKFQFTFEAEKLLIWVLFSSTGIYYYYYYICAVSIPATNFS